MKKQVQKPATQVQIDKLFTSAFDGYEDDGKAGTVERLRKSEVKTGNAFYAQGKDCIDSGIDAAISAKFKGDIDRKARPSANGTPKTHKQKADQFVAQAAKSWSPAEIKYLKSIVDAM